MHHSSGVATRTCLHTSLSLADVVGHHRNASPILSLELVQAKPSQQDQSGDPQYTVAGRGCQDSCSLSAHTKPWGRGWRQLSSVARAGVGCVVLPGWHSMSRETAGLSHSSLLPGTGWWQP